MNWTVGGILAIIIGVTIFVAGSAAFLILFSGLIAMALAVVVVTYLFGTKTVTYKEDGEKSGELQVRRYGVQHDATKMKNQVDMQNEVCYLGKINSAQTYFAR